MRAHEDVAGVQGALQKVLFRLRDVDPSQRGFWQCVSWHKSKAIDTHLVDAVDGLEKEETVAGVTGVRLLLLAALAPARQAPAPEGTAGARQQPRFHCNVSEPRGESEVLAGIPASTARFTCNTSIFNLS